MSNSVTGQNGPTPARRSVRLASIPRSAVSVDQSLAGASTTPGRASSRRKGTLPKVKANHSTAYGSSTRMGAAQDIQVNHSGFAQGFDDLRGKALTRDDDVNLVDNDEPTEDVDDQLNGDRASVSERGSPVSDLRPHSPTQEPSSSNGQFRVAHISEQSLLTSRRVVTRPAHEHTSAESSHRGARQSYVEDDEDGIDNASSPTPSQIDTSKSFGQVHEGGMPMTGLGANIPAQPLNAYQADRELPRTSGYRREAGLARPVNVSSYTGTPRFHPGATAVRAPVRLSPRVRLSQVGRDEHPDDHDLGADNDVGTSNFWKFDIAKLLYAIIGLLLLTLLSRQFQGSTSTTAPLSPPGLIDAISARISYNWEGMVHWIAPPNFTAASTSTPDITNLPSAKDEYKVDMPAKPFDPTAPDYVTNFERIFELEKQAKGIVMNLEHFLPQTVVVVRKDDGDLEIPDEFWRAILSKLQSGDAAWEEYLEKNRLALRNIFENDWDRRISLERAELSKLIEKKYIDMGERIEQKMKASLANLDEQITTALDREVTTAKDYVAQRAANAVLTDMRTQYLALTHLTDMIRVNTQMKNFFSLGNGARINAHETSPTYSKDTSFWSGVSRSVLSSARRLPPVAALRSWEEPGDCWCAAPDKGTLGLAQLSVTMGQRVNPTQVTIEHLPKAASVDIRSAPKEIELWAPAGEVRLEAPGCHAGPAGYACLGRFSYDVHGSTYIQTFNLDGEAVPTGIGRALVRVTSNYAGDFTCLYRVRLHGEVVTGSG